MRFLPFCLFAVSAQMVHVGTTCLRLVTCIDDHKADVTQYFEENPGKYEHIQTFLDYSFISTSYYKVSDDYSVGVRLPETEPTPTP